MANTIDIGNLTTLIIKIPARGATNWSSEFKDYFADVIADHDHTSGQGARIKNAALVTNTMVANGDGVTDHENVFTAYTSADVAVSTDTIQDNAVTGAKLSSSATVDSDRAVDSNHIKDNAILSRHIALDVLQDIDIAPDSIGTSELKIDAVETENITDLNVTTAKIADANVTAAKIGSDVVLSTLNDVSSTSPSTNDTLEWSGTEWTPTTKVITITTNTTLSTSTSDTTFILTSGANLTIENTVQRCNVISKDINCELQIGSSGRFNHNYVNITGKLGLTDWDVESGTYSEFSYNHGYIGKLSGNQDQSAPPTPTGNDTQSNGIFSYNNLIFTDVIESINVPLGTVQHNKLIFNQNSTNSSHRLDLYAEDDSQLTVYWYSSVDSTNYIKFLKGGRLAETNVSPILGSWNTPWVLSNDIVTRLNTPISLSAPTTGQSLQWDGAEWAPGMGAVDIINTASEASSYSGTNRIIYVTATVPVTFTSSLSDRLIFGSSGSITFKEEVRNCKITSESDIIFNNDKTDGSSVLDCVKNDIQCSTLTFDASSNTTGNGIYMWGNNIKCTDLDVVFRSNIVTVIEATKIYCRGTLSGGDVTNNLQISQSNIDVQNLSGNFNVININYPNYINSRAGLISSGSSLLLNATTYIDDIYNHPFRVNKDGVHTNIAFDATLSSNQEPITSAGYQKINFDVITENTSAWDATNYRFITKVKGLYKISLHGNIGNCAAGEQNFVRISKNGSEVRNGAMAYLGILTASYIGSCAIILELDVDDYIEGFTRSSDNSWSILYFGTHLLIEKVNG